MSSVYTINKGINKPITFKGLKAQYIWYLGGGLVGLLVLFAVLYVVGLNTFICLALVVILGTALFLYIGRLSHIYGEHGLMKKRARYYTPNVVHCHSRNVFTSFSKKYICNKEVSHGTRTKRHTAHPGH